MDFYHTLELTTEEIKALKAALDVAVGHETEEEWREHGNNEAAIAVQILNRLGE